MDYEQKYKEALEKARQFIERPLEEDSSSIVEYIFPELAESEDELTWLTKYIEEEAYNLSIDIRDDEDSIKLKKLQKALVWLEKQGENKSSAWSKEDEIGLGDALWAIQQARTIAKDENDMGNLWYAEDWLKSLKQRIKGE